jgi:hypothetical protein
MKKVTSTARWDAVLNSDACDPYTNAEITLTLRLGFRQINPAGGAAAGTYHDYGDPTAPTRKIIKWTVGEWHKWTRDLTASAQRYWSGRYWLTNNFPELEFNVRGVSYRPNVWCKLNIVSLLGHGAGVIHGAHHTIDVVRLDATEHWFGSHSTLYDSLDTTSVQKATDSLGHPIMQRAHVHEIGHLLGLAHVDVGKAHCPAAGDTNAGVCYGVADRDKQAVMGDGMALRAAFATPWRRAAILLTGKGHIAGHHDWQARLQQIYPRTSAEVAAGRTVTVRPVRV